MILAREAQFSRFEDDDLREWRERQAEGDADGSSEEGERFSASRKEEGEGLVINVMFLYMPCVRTISKIVANGAMRIESNIRKIQTEEELGQFYMSEAKSFSSQQEMRYKFFVDKHLEWFDRCVYLY